MSSCCWYHDALVKGPNRFGQKGSLRCDAVGLPHNGSTCKGMLFCLPDPYGCSCAAGYQGLECKTGTFLTQTIGNIIKSVPLIE